MKRIHSTILCDRRFNNLAHQENKVIYSLSNSQPIPSLHTGNDAKNILIIRTMCPPHLNPCQRNLITCRTREDWAICSHGPVACGCKTVGQHPGKYQQPSGAPMLAESGPEGAAPGSDEPVFGAGAEQCESGAERRATPIWQGEARRGVA